MAELAEVLPGLWPLVVGALGAVAGSFANCAAYRVPRGLSMRQPPSQCPACGTRLGILDLVPILSYISLRGRCRQCQAPVPLTSLGIEVLLAAVALGIYALVGPWWGLWPALAGGLGLAVAGVVLVHGYRPWPAPHRGAVKARVKTRRR
jgi:prepilin signal peptidase PulO-like enzyme (type II secretory pathway)